MQNNRITEPHALSRVEKLAHLLLRAESDAESLGFDEVDASLLNQDWKRGNFPVMTADEWLMLCRNALAKEMSKLTGQAYFSS